MLLLVLSNSETHTWSSLGFLLWFEIFSPITLKLGKQTCLGVPEHKSRYVWPKPRWCWQLLSAKVQKSTKSYLLGFRLKEKINTSFRKGNKSILLNGAESKTDWLLLCWASYLPQAVVCHVSCVCKAVEPMCILCCLFATWSSKRGFLKDSKERGWA